jgi:hypothetical protein
MVSGHLVWTQSLLTIMVNHHCTSLCAYILFQQNMETYITNEKNETKKITDELLKCKAEIGLLQDKINNYKYYLVCYLNIYQN